MKKGLVLEGGAMRGMFTAGVMDVLLENNIEFDGAVGISAGATFGCNYKSKQIGRVIRYNKRFAGDSRYGSFKSLFKTGDLFEADFCYHKIPFELDPFDFETYQNNPMEFWLGVTDLKTGKAAYHKNKTGLEEDLEWMRASASIPLVSTPVKIGESLYLDGGISDSIPLKFFESIGYDKNVVILTQPKDFVKKQNKFVWLAKILLRKYPNFVNAIKNRHHMYNAETEYVFSKAEKGEIFVIYPEHSLGIASAEHNPQELQRVYDEGRKTALEKLDQLKKFLEC